MVNLHLVVDPRLPVDEVYLRVLNKRNENSKWPGLAE